MQPTTASIPQSAAPLSHLSYPCYGFLGLYHPNPGSGPQSCSVGSDGRLQPIAVWKLRTDCAPAGILRGETMSW
jgi:hypothetical protein